jgi:type I restriction enzyme S subunit
VVGKYQQLHQDSADIKLDLEQPEGWAFPKIGDILSINYGKGLKKSNRNKGTIPVYGSNGMVGQHNSALTKGQTIILGRKGTVGAVNFSPVPCWPIDTTYFIDQFHGLVPRFIFHAMRNLNLGALDTSTAIPGLNKNDIYNQQIPLPPVPEQKRIVAKVEELLGRVNAVRERLAKVKEILKRFRQSVLAAALSGSLTEDWRKRHSAIMPAEVSIREIFSLREKQWEIEIGPEKKYKPPKNPETKSLPDIPESWKYVSSDVMFLFVTSGSRGWAKYYSEAGSTFLRVGNLDHDTVNLDLSHTQHVDPPNGAERERTRVRGGDILISITADVGMIGLVPDKVGEA